MKRRLHSFANPESGPVLFELESTHIVHKFERLRARQREAERQAEHLFQTLLHRAFRGESGVRS
jgi:hypothetical protein